MTTENKNKTQEIQGKGATVLTENQSVRDKISVWHESNTEWMQMVKELIGNSLDVKAKNIKIKILNNNHIIFEDDAYGLPVELFASDGRPNHEAIFQKLFAGTKYDKEEATVGTNGVFLTTLAFSSYNLKVEVARPNGNVYTLEYKQGERIQDLKIIGQSEKTYTKLEFVLDEEVWESPNFTFESICAFAEPQSSLQEVKIEVLDIEESKSAIYNYNNLDNYYDNYKEEMNNILEDNIRIKRKLKKDSIMNKKKITDDIEFDLIFNFSPMDSVLQKEFLNTADLVNYGRIQEGIAKGLKESFEKDLYSSKQLKPSQKITQKDVLDGLNYICNFKSRYAEFVNQTKKSTNVIRYVNVLRDEIVDFFEIYKAENPEQYESILKKIVSNIKARVGATKEREKILKAAEELSKNNKNQKIKIEGLKDCDMKATDFQDRILISCEGKSPASAIASAMTKDMGLLALRGRFINCLSHTVDKVLSNSPAYTLIKALGCGVEIPSSERKKFGDIKSFNIDNLRYNKLALASDADSFGANINIAQLTMVYKYMPELIKRGHVYYIRTPRYMVTIGKGKKQQKIYAYDKKELENIKTELNSNNTKYDIGIKKGLAEFNKNEFYDLVLSKEGQKKSFIKIEYSESIKDEIDRLFELFMGSDSDARKDYIQKNIIKLSNEIDKDGGKLNNLLEVFYKTFAEDIVDNNLPKIDGMLNAHRKIIWGNYQNKVFPEKNYMKLLRMGAYAMTCYVYGDMPLHKTMKNMGNDSLMYKYIDGYGEYGNVNKRDDGGAAPRYIEGRLDKYSMELLKGVDKNSVPMMDNFDGTIKEPVVVPSIVPNILLNPSISISAGYSSKIPAFNSIELINTLEKYIKKQDDDLIYSLVPDFSKGAKVIYDKDKFKKILKEGRGSFKQIGKYKFDKEKNIFSITEIPSDSYIENIDDALEIHRDKFKEIKYFNDNSGIVGLSLDIKLKEGVDLDKFIAKLRKYTEFEKSFSINFTLLDLDHKTPKRMSLKEIIDKWIQFRVGCIKNEIEYDIKMDKLRKEVLEGYRVILSNIERAIDIIKRADDDNEAIEILKCEFELTKLQARKVSEIKLIKLNQKNLENRIKDLKLITERIDSNKEIVNDEDKIKKIIIEQLVDFKGKFGKPRLTEVIYNDDIGDKIDKISIEEYNTQLYLTKDGYFKKVKSIENKGNNKLKDGDVITKSISSTNSSEIIFITNKQNGYKKWAYELENNSMNSYGLYLKNYLELESDEEVINMISIDDHGKGYICHIYYDEENKLVKMAKIKPEAYKTKTNRTKLANCINSDVGYIDSIYTKDNISAFSISNNGRVFIFNSDNANAKASKDSMGINIMKDVDLYKSMFVNSNDSIEFKTEKGKDVRLTLSDLFDERGDEGRTWYEYLSGKNASKGNYLLANRKDKVIELKINN